MDFDVSCISVAADTQKSTRYVDETMSAASMIIPPVIPFKRPQPETSEDWEFPDLKEIRKGGFFLDGCKIHLHGFNPSLMEKVKKILVTAGGLLYQHPSPGLSHVVLAGKDETFLEQLRRKEFGCHIVDAKWLVECCKSKRHLDENEFSISSASPAEVTVVEPPSKKKAKVGVGSMGLEDESLLLQYIDAGGESIKSRYDAGSTKGEETTGEELTIVEEVHFDVGAVSQIFNGLTFQIMGLNSDEAKSVKKSILQNGGLVSPHYNNKTDYAVVPFLGIKERVQAFDVVTSLFIDDCMNAQQVLDVTYYHKPVKMKADVDSPLRECIATLSLYSDCERVFLTKALQALGARTQEQLTRRDKPDIGLRANTHLVCLSPEGPKYEAAKKWGVICVSGWWILACAQHGIRIPESDYPPGMAEPFDEDDEEEEEEKGESTLHNNVEKDDEMVIATPAPQATRKTSVSGASPSLTSTNAHDGPIVSMRPRNWETPPIVRQALKVERKTPLWKRDLDDPEVKLYLAKTKTPDLGKLNDHFPTPRRRKLFELEVNAAPPLPTPPEKRLKRLLDYHYPPSMEQLENEAFEHLDRVKDKFCKAIDREMEKRKLTQDSQRAEKKKDAKTAPLAGVVIHVQLKSADLDKESELYEMVDSLGGKCQHQYDDQVTHLVFQGRGNAKVLKQAREGKKFVVSPEWVTTCAKEMSRADELLFPYSSTSATPASQLSVSRIPRTPCQMTKKMEKTAAADVSLADEEPQSDKSSSSVLERHLEDLKRITKQPIEWTKVRRLGSSGTLPPPTAEAVQQHPEQLSTGDKPQNGASIDECQGVTWDDPVARKQKEKLLEYFENEGATQSQELPLHTSQPKLFMFSRIDDQERERYKSVLEKFGAMVSEGGNYDPAATHLITERPLRNEKVLSCIAAGKWVLGAHYINASIAADRLLPEEEFEWGSEEMFQAFPELSDDERRRSRAAQRWRQEIQSGKKSGAFSHITAIIHTPPHRREAFTRFLMAGKGQVSSAKPPYRDIEGVTHVFVEKPSECKEPIDIAYLHEHGLECLVPLYLNDYLMGELQPIEKYYETNYKRFVDSLA